MTTKKLKVVVQKTRDGRDYMQIMSDDYTDINVVLIAEIIELEDTR